MTGCQHGAMTGEPSGSRLFHGAVAILQPGDMLPDGAQVSNNPAEALAAAWMQATERTGTPFLYEVVVTKGHAFTVISDVLIDARLAGQALELLRQSSS